MASILRVFRLLFNAVRAFFKADIRLRRGDKGVQVVLEERPVDPATPKKKRVSKRDKASQEEALKQARELSQIQGSLAQLLDALPVNRQALRHLAFIEHALERKGLRALHKVPYDVLHRALSQLDGLVLNWSDPGLASLRSRMAVVLIEREPERTHAVAAPGDAGASVMEGASLAHPEALDGDAAAEAEQALRAAYGDMTLPGLSLDVPPDNAPAVEVQTELPRSKAAATGRREGVTA